MAKQNAGKKREERKLRKKVRKEAFKKLEQTLTAIKEIDFNKSMTFKEKFIEAWPVVKPGLEFAIILNITGEKLDDKINKLVIIGDNMAGNKLSTTEAQEFQDNLNNKWNFVETALEVAKLLANDKQDEAIDKIIDIGDWMFEKQQ